MAFREIKDKKFPCMFGEICMEIKEAFGEDSIRMLRAEVWR
jgi:hypothetical protein